MKITKDESVDDLIVALGLHEKGWKIIDYWEADLHAIGIGSERTPGKLVYISTFGKLPGYYDFECEEFNPINPSDFRAVFFGNDVNLSALESILRKWLV